MDIDGESINNTHLGDVQITGDLLVDGSITGGSGNGSLTIENLIVSGTTDSVSTSTGALTVSGGVGIEKSVNIGANCQIDGNLTVSGSQTISGGIYQTDGFYRVGDTNPADVIDQGLLESYTSGGVKYGAMYRKAGGGFEFKEDISVLPTTVVSGGSYADVGSGSLTINGSTSGSVQLTTPATGGSLNVNGNISVSNISCGSIVSVSAIDQIQRWVSSDVGNCYASWESGANYVNAGYDSGNNKAFLDASTSIFDINFAGVSAFTYDTTGMTVKNGRAIQFNGSTSGSIKFSPSAISGTQAYILPASGPSESGVPLLSTTGGTMSWGDSNLSKSNSSTGIYYGGILSIGTPTSTFSLSDGAGIVITDNLDGTFTKTPVSWTGKTNIAVTNIATQNITFIYINSSGTVLQSSTGLSNTQTRDNIYIGVVVHTNRSIVNTVNNEQHIVQAPTSQVRDLFHAIGFFTVSGNVISAPSTNLSIAKSAGVLFGDGINYSNNIQDPHTLSIPSIDTNASGIFQYRNYDGSSSALTLNRLLPALYDNGGVYNGTTPAVAPASRWTVQRVFTFVSGVIKIQPGQTIYNSLASAENGISTDAFIVEPSIASNGVLIGYIIIQGSCTNTADTSTCKFISVGKFSVKSGGNAVSSLQLSYDASDVNPEILTNSIGGKVSIRNGQSLDTDLVLSGQNIAGTDTFTVAGNGRVDMASCVISSNLTGDNYVSTIVNTNDNNADKCGLLIKTTASTSYNDFYGLTLQNDYCPTSYDNSSIRWLQDTLGATPKTSVLGVSSTQTTGTSYPPASMFISSNSGLLYLDNQELRFHNTADKTIYVGLKQPAGLAVSKTYTLPLLDGSSGQQLTTDGSGVLSWANNTASLALDDLSDCYTISTTGNVINMSSFNTVIGDNSSISQGTYSTVVGGGAGALLSGTKGLGDSFYGYQAGYSADHQDPIDASSYNVCFGYQSGYSLSKGSYNTLLGASTSCDANSEGQIAIGYGATTVLEHTCMIGGSSLTYIASGGGKNCDLGATSYPFGGIYLGGSTSGYNKLECSAVGDNTTYTLPAVDGTNGYVLSTNGSGVLTWVDNIGAVALGDLSNCSTTATSGDVISINATSGNLLMGNSAGTNITSATSCVCIGDNSGASITSTLQCVAVGKGADCALANSTSLGYNASCSGANGCAIGYSTNASGLSSVCLGTGSISAYENATAVGATCSTVSINSVALGNNAVVTVHPTSDNLCNLGAGSYRWKEVFAGNATINTSDIRHKENIKDLDLGIDFINELEPKKYTFKNTEDGQEHYGIIAQDVENLLKSKLSKKDKKKYKNKGLIHYCEESDIYGVRYAEFIPILINGIKDLSKENKELKERLDKIELWISDNTE